MSDASTIHEASRFLRAAREIVVFTGAGISAESGISTFRDNEGLWRRFPPDRFATWEGLLKTAVADPRLFAEFLIAVLEPIAAARPNPGHLAIAELEKRARVTVVTQNIDGLHQAAGSTRVYEVHGSLFEIVSLKGRFVKLLSRAEVMDLVVKLKDAVAGPLALPRILAAVRPVLGLGPTTIHRPKVVLFGEAMAEPAWSLAQEAAKSCDCLLTVGTSATVMPAALLPGMADSAGAHIISINPVPAEADINLTGPAATVLPALVKAAFG
jgi:NAD-dependent deacetylase